MQEADHTPCKHKGYSSVNYYPLRALELGVNINKATGGQLKLKKWPIKVEYLIWIRITCITPDLIVRF